MKYKLVVDFEATCSERNEFPREEMEIIEIGAVLIDENNIIVGEYEQLVKPVLNGITSFCTQLTGITQEEVDTGVPFKQAITEFLAWINTHVDSLDDLRFLSWGDFDRNILVRDAKRVGVDVRRLVSLHTNAKAVFAIQNDGRARGVMGALRLKGMEFEGLQHRALADARNIAKLVVTLK